MNPFETLFGKEPKEYIPRLEETEKIVTSFQTQNNGCYLISGVRGMGKTVILTHISKRFSKEKNWIVIDVNPEKDILSSLTAKLYSQGKLGSLFMKKSFSVGAYGFSLTLTSGEEIVDPENALEIMLKEIKKQKKKLLITIDEVTNTKEVKIFIHTFQSFLRMELPVFLLMTGLGENIYSLQNEKTLTFLYRAPKYILGKLSSISIKYGYSKVFKNDKLAQEMTNMVDGYAFAYQLMGSIVYERKTTEIDDKILEEFDARLAEYVYEKIWNEVGPMDKKIIRAIYHQKGISSKIMAEAGMEKNKFSVYRDRLKQKGYLDVSQRGVICFILPRFDSFLQKYDFED